MRTSPRSRPRAGSSASWSIRRPARSTASTAPARPSRSRRAPATRCTCEGRLYSVPWHGESALMLVLVRTAAADRLRDSEIALRAAEAETRELRSILDTATDGVIVVDRDGLVLTLQPLGRGAVRLRVSRDGAPAVHRAVRAGKRARRARLSRRADARTASPACSTTGAR